MRHVPLLAEAEMIRGQTLVVDGGWSLLARAVVGRPSALRRRMKPWRAAETSATASGKSTRIASRRASACASGGPSTWMLPERRRGQLDGGVQRERRELLALGLLHRLGLLLRELAQRAEELLGIAAAEREEAASAFHAPV